MSQKRQQREEGSSFDERHPRKSKSFKSVVLEVMNLCKLQHLMEPVLEPLIRRVVKEEVDSALRKYIINTKRYDVSICSEFNKMANLGHSLRQNLLIRDLLVKNRNCGKDAHPSESRNLCLQFSNAISLPVFTGTRIEGDGSTRLEVALIDSISGEVVSSGHGSSGNVEIVVLEGDFDGDERGNWTLVEFQNNTVRERTGKKPLLTGDLITALQDGKGFIGNIMFTDNSSWTRSRKFSLGARLLDRIGGIRVQEARSEPFVVRDHRGELYKKHHPPSLFDEVWRLEKIGKDGAFHKRLREERVNTVEDFLVSFFLDPKRLRNILGVGMSAKMWEVAVEHARTCVLDQKLQFYGASQDNGVVFNIVGKLMGIISNGQYFHADKLSETEKTEAHELVVSAFADREKIVSFGDDSSPKFPTSSSLSVVQSSSNLLTETSFHDDLRSKKIGGSSYLQQNASSPDYMESVYSVGGLSTFEDCLHHAGFSYHEQVTDGLICNTDTFNRAFCADELQYFETDSAIQSSPLEVSDDIQGAISAYIPYSDVPIGKAQRGWNILVFVLRWWFSIRRIVARKNPCLRNIKVL